MPVATVFDLDETLVDSSASWQRVLGTVAARHGYAWTPADWAAIQGTSTAHWSTYLARRSRNVTPEAVVGECVDGMVEAIRDGRVGLLPGAADLVAAAAALGPAGLVSASPRRYLDSAVTAFGLVAHLRVTVAGEDVERGKPAPDPYLLAARLLGVAPADCVAVEDSASGIRSAHAAGMTVLAIPNAATAQDFATLELAHHHAADARIAAKTLGTLAG
ncbi:HAD family hydrolase [Amycolatopsis sp. RTGN1]|uniref:HAD family hydrolase n=1 Tax=Amycolatopsis ponsaeliensis TaxID=2992142 RepID=UPI00255199D1|nr:HAD family phosphatase [Amycolatopsis sp. RTGN1]